MDDYIKGLFASTETSGDIIGDYLRLEKKTFIDLKQRKLIPNEITWDKTKKFPQIYDQVAQVYLQDLMTTFKIPTVEEAALWSYRPGWYQKYQGDPTKIPDILTGSAGKSGKAVMLQRVNALQKYITEKNATITNTPTGAITTAK